MSEERPVCDCGLPMSRNPHTDAGKPSMISEVGAWFVCIPCTVKSRRLATQRYWSLLRKVESLWHEIHASTAMWFVASSVRNRVRNMIDWHHKQK